MGTLIHKCGDLDVFGFFQIWKYLHIQICRGPKSKHKVHLLRSIPYAYPEGNFMYGIFNMPMF